LVNSQFIVASSHVGLCHINQRRNLKFHHTVFTATKKEPL
jgi:hypothetical protein